ncbi:fimbrial biogenesis chaperone [Parasphingorhabdus sp.]
MLRKKPAFFLSCLILMAALMVIPANIAQAMRVSPMVVEMKNSGSGAVARIEVQNLNSADLPFETLITRIDFDDEGNVVETPADPKDFLVFPGQGILGADKRQVVRVQWVGPPIETSRGYYLSVNQIPVELGPRESSATGAQVQVVYHMKVLITVAPPKAAPEVSVVSAIPTMVELPKAEDGTEQASVPGVEVRVKNTGNRHAMMAGVVWTIEGKDLQGERLVVQLSLEDLNRYVGVGYLAALNGDRSFKLPTGKAFGSGPIKVKFSQ